MTASKGLPLIFFRVPMNGFHSMYRIVLVNNEIKVGQMIVSFLLVNQSNLDLNLSKHSFLPGMLLFIPFDREWHSN